MKRILIQFACAAFILALSFQFAQAARTVLRVPLLSPVPGLDPGIAEDNISIEITEQLFLGLTDFDDETSEVVPELATSWEVSADGLKYTFHLRKTNWSDGKPVTAHDLVWAARRNINPANAAPYAYMIYGVKNGEAINKGKIKDTAQLGVRALDDYTVEITLENPAAYFPAVAGMWMLRPLPRHAIEQHGDKWTEAGNMISNGPYQLVSWAKGDKLVLKKSASYFEAGKVAIQEIHYLIVTESTTGLALYENGDLDLMGARNYLPIPSPDLPRIKADSILSREFTVGPALCTYYYGFNNSRPPMDNKLVRKAFSASINRQLLIDKVVRGEQTPATTFTRPPIFGSVDPKEGVGIGYNPEQARKWLAEAGYPNGNNFPEVVLMHNTSENHAKIAQAIQQMWRRTLNVNIRLENQEWKVYLKTTKENSGPHIFRLGWCADYPDANNWLLEVFHPTKATNRLKWDNAEFASVTERAQLSGDPKERLALYRRAEVILNEEQAAIAPIYFYTSPTLTKPYLKMKIAPMGGNHIKDWHFTD